MIVASSAGRCDGLTGTGPDGGSDAGANGAGQRLLRAPLYWPCPSVFQTLFRIHRREESY
jgi:hypothetical protein